MIVHVSVIHAFFKMSCSHSVTCESKARFSRMNELEVRLWFSFPSQSRQQVAEGSANNCVALGGSKGCSLYTYLEPAGLDAGLSACNMFLNILCNKVMVLSPFISHFISDFFFLVKQWSKNSTMSGYLRSRGLFKAIIW